MRVEHKIVGASIAAGLAAWTIDIVLDYLVFSDGFVLDFSASHSPTHELYVRVPALICFLAFGLVLSQILVRRERAWAERLRAKEILLASEENYRTIFDSANDAFFVHDPDTGVIIDVNQKACELYATSRDRLLRSDVGEISSNSPPYTLQDALRWIQLAAAGQPQIFEWLSKDGTGRLFWTEVNLKLITIGGQRRLLAVVRDITDRKQAEQALRASELNYRTIFDSASDAIFVHDRQTGAIIDANREAIRTLGYPLEELRRINVGDFSAGTPPYTQEEAARRMQAAAEGRPQLFEWLGKDRSGRLFWVEVNLKLVTIAGQDRILAVARNINDRKQAEERLRALSSRHEAILAAVPDIVAEVDTNKVYTWLNPAGLEFFGHDAVGKEAAYYFEGEQDTYNVVQPLFNGQENVIYVESWQRRRDGQKRLLAWWCRVLKDAEGNVTGAISTARDITDQRRAEQERLQLEQQMQQAQKLESLGVLAGGIAHDFNNLLTAVVAHAGLALRHLPEDSPARANVEQIETAGRRAAELTNQLLAYSGRSRFVVRGLDLSKLVEEMADLLQLSISKRATLKYDLAGNLPAVQADAAQIRQVVMNLITNASDALQDKPGTITISTGVVDADRAYLAGAAIDDELPEGRYVYLEVSDTGCGMDPETRARMFEPFFSTKSAGRGLGLAAVMGIIRGHQGGLRVYSEPQRGTAFKILLPSAPQTEPAPEVQAPFSEGWRGCGTILVVDDDPGVRRVATMILKEFGFSVLNAENGQQAIDIFQQQPEAIALVLLDMTMPDMTGDEVFERLRRLRPDVRVILSSGYNEQETTARLTGLGGVSFIQKPYQLEGLVAKVRQVLERA